MKVIYILKSVQTTPVKKILFAIQSLIETL